MTRSNDPTKFHFVLATAMDVDANGEPTYITNNPGTRLGQNQARPANAEKVKGYRLYRPTFDPSMLFFYLTGDAGMIITDPQGRRTGYDPVTNLSYNEIPGAVFNRAESIDDPDDGNVSTVPESNFESLEPLNGNYSVKVIAKTNTKYTLAQYSFDTVGTMNTGLKKEGTLMSTNSIIVNSVHTQISVPIKRGSINIEKADFFDTKYRDMAFISGNVKFAEPILDVQSNIGVKIGSVTKVISVKQLIKTKFKGKTFYSYGSFGKKSLFLSLNIDTGDLNLFVGNIDLDTGDIQITSDLVLQIDDFSAQKLVTFKNVRKTKIKGR